MNEQDTGRFDDQIEWLKMLLALVVAALLAAVYILAPFSDESPRWFQLVHATIPSALVVLIAIPAVYFILHRRGLTWKQQVPDLVRDVLQQPAALDQRQVDYLVDQIAAKLSKDGILTPDAEFLGDFFSAAKRITALLAASPDRHSLKVIAVTARGTMQAYLADILQNYTGQLDIELRVADFTTFPWLIDPRWPDEQAKTVPQIIERCRARGFRIDVSRYPYSPCIVGHLIDDSHLVIAFYVWDRQARTLGDLQESYMYYHRSSSTERHFVLFENWLYHSPRQPW